MHHPLYYLIVAIIDIFIAFIPAMIAKRKGHSFIGYFIFSLFFFLIALIVALVVSDKNAPPAGSAPTPPPVAEN